jgi:glutathione S-transferase
MGAVMSEVILHHFTTSPFAEKVRTALGIKGLAWRSVLIPRIMPKPDLMPLTGGYRKTPVMQIGADVYCDTQCIMRELERRFPEPSLYRGTDAGTANALAFWCDRTLFSPAVGIVFAARPEILEPGFLEDRSKFMGRELSVERLKAATPVMLDLLRPHFAWIEAMLADGRPFLTGAHPTLVDCSVYNPTWFITTNMSADAAPLDELPRLRAWYQRMEKIGHGKPTEMSSQEALAVAKAAQPTTQQRIDEHDSLGRKPGMRVQVTPDDAGRDPVSGELVAISPYEVVIRRSDPQVGEVDVHFPRAGFVIQRA